MTIRNLATLALMAGLLVCTHLQAAESAAKSEKRTAPVKAGDFAPDFALPDQDGRRHVLSGERGKRAVVLIFYRGHW